MKTLKPPEPDIAGLKIKVIFNPAAGISNPWHLERRIREFLVAKGALFDFHNTSLEENTSEVVRGAITEGYNLILAAGGDGTISQVANGIAGTSILMGVIPCGSGNIIAKDLRIPMRLTDALSLIFSVGHKVILADAMKVGENYYVLNVSAGFSASVFKDIDPRLKRRLGIFSYLWNGLLQLAGIQPERFTVNVDGRTFRFSASDVLIPNSAVIGWNPLKLDPDGWMDDGKLSLCILRARNLVDFIRIAWNMLLRRQKVAREMELIEIKQWVEVSSRRLVPVQGDGDYIGVTPFRVDFYPKLVHIIVPENYSSP